MVIGGGRTEVGPVGRQDRVWAHAGQIHKQVRRPQQMGVSVYAYGREVEGGSAGVGVNGEHEKNVVKVGVGFSKSPPGYVRNGVPGGTFMRLSSCVCDDLEDGPCREVRPVPHTRVQLSG